MRTAQFVIVCLLYAVATFWLTMAGFFHEWWETQIADIAKAILALLIAKVLTPDDPVPTDPYEDITF